MKKKYSSIRAGAVASALVGFCTSCVIALGVMCLISMLILREHLTISQLLYIVPCLHFATLLIGGFIAGMINDEVLLYSNAIIVALQYLLCVGVTILAFDGRFFGFIPCVVMGLVGSVCATLICLSIKGKAKKRFGGRKFC